MAEREGFEPSIRFCRILTFQASAFDHSATAPAAPGRVHNNRFALEGGHVGKAARRGNLAATAFIPLCDAHAALRDPAIG
jgi:hypothetical protein